QREHDHRGHYGLAGLLPGVGRLLVHQDPGVPAAEHVDGDQRGGDEAADPAHAAPREPKPAERYRVRVMTEDRDQASDGEDADPGVLDRDQDPLGPRRQLDPDVGDNGGQHHRDEPDDRLAGPAAGVAEQGDDEGADGQGDKDHAAHG